MASAALADVIDIRSANRIIHLFPPANLTAGSVPAWIRFRTAHLVTVNNAAACVTVM